MKQFFNFLQYHNAVPIALGVLFLGAGATFAATDPQAILASQQQVLSVDNSYIANKDLSTYQPRVVITSVAEDTDNYYVAYTFTTIDVQNDVWKDIDKQDSMTVSKASLGTNTDLGLYVSDQLSQLISHEEDRLKETQDVEKQHVTPKVVSTEYSGLVGRFLDGKTETLPGYTPVVTPPPPAPAQPQVASASLSEQSQPAAPAAETQPLTPDEIKALVAQQVQQILAQQQPLAAGSSGSNPSPVAPTGVPVISVNGNNPAQLTVGDTYADLGATITGPTPADTNLGIHTFVDGASMAVVLIDASAPGTHTIEYVATNAAGTATSTRTVVVSAPASSPATTTPDSTPVTPPASSTPVTSSIPNDASSTPPAPSGGGATDASSTATSTAP